FKEGVSMKWSNGSPNINILYSPLWNRIFGNARNKNEDINQHHMNIASSVQKFTEIIICKMLNKLYDKVKLKNLCLSGGVIQNSVLNGKIIEKTKFENIYIPAAAHDAGTSIGSGLYLYNQILRNKRLPASFTSYLGSKFKETEIIDLLRQNNIQYRKLNDNDLYNEVSNNLISGGVVGWFQGRAEFGPRALGHRSILVDPRREDAKEILNIKIKRRERFRPFAPSILREFISEYFNINESVPFMEKVYLIKKEKRKKIPAVTHIDGTGRLQTVDKRISPKYHALITNFFEKTSIPILLNTSFNENEPIVNTPKEALDCFLRTKMDLLVMENIIIKR
ncbi:MAG: carbamoyltransferase, partial [Flavobacteriales bacterium]|nr:carbamoyltransferase [Flavobacteriales bacterium]